MIRSRQKAFAATTAIILLGLVAIALGLLATYISFEARRSADAVSHQQLEQLLLAGQQAAQAQLQSSNNIRTEINIALPHELDQLEASLKLEPAKLAGDSAIVKVQAKLGRRQSSQTITFGHNSGNWKIVGAVLEQ